MDLNYGQLTEDFQIKKMAKLYKWTYAFLNNFFAKILIRVLTNIKTINKIFCLFFNLIFCFLF